MSALGARAVPPSGTSLADLLERVLDKGIVIAGDVEVRLLDIELLTLKLRLLIASADTARSMGIDWWEHDPALSSLYDLARILAERDLDVGDLIREAEEDARADVAETLRRLFADDLLRRVGERIGGRPLVALAGVADGLRPLVLELEPGALDDE